MVKCGVLFEVRTEFLNIIYTSFGFKMLTHRIAIPLLDLFVKFSIIVDTFNSLMRLYLLPKEGLLLIRFVSNK
jgi:hypothetical protein